MKVSRARCAISGRLGLSLALRGWWLACVRSSLVGTDAGETRHGRWWRAGRKTGAVCGRAGSSPLGGVSSRPWGVSGVTLRRGRGRPRSEAQVLGLMPAAQLAPQRAFSVASRWRRPRPASFAGALACQSATSWRYARSACSASSRSRRRTSLRLYAAAVPLLAAAGWHAGAELERAQLLLGQRRAGERVVLAALDHRPAQHASLRAVATTAICIPRRAADALDRTRAADPGS